MMADEVRRGRHGARTTFVRVATVPAAVSDALPAFGAAGELRIVGMPASRASAIERIAAVARAAGGRPVSGFSLADLIELGESDGTPVRSLLEQLREAGLELIAEAPIDRLEEPRRSIEAVAAAGLAVARLTVDRSPSADPMPLLKSVAELQRTLGTLRAFAPLPRRVNPAAPTTGFDDVKRVALARIVADNVPSIQVDWALYGPKLAQVALTVGADDVDGVSPDEDIEGGRRRSPLEEIRRNVRAAGFEAIERDGRWNARQPAGERSR